MGLWVCRVAGGLVLLALTLLAVIGLTDVYAIDFFCFAEGHFVPDTGGPALDVVLAGDCGEQGTEVRVLYVRSLREHLPLLEIPVHRGTWAELATVAFGVMLFVAMVVFVWWAAARIMLDPVVSEERYGVIRVASSCAEADLVAWLEDNFDAAWVELLPGGGAAAHVAIIDDDVVLSEELTSLSEVGRSLAGVGGTACIQSRPNHIHFARDSLEEAQPWGACSLQPDDDLESSSVTILRHDPEDGMPVVDADTGAVLRDGWMLLLGDSASHNSAELDTSAAVMEVRGKELSLDFYENGRLVGRSRWNNQGSLVGNRGGTFELRAICPSWPAPLWADELKGFRMPEANALSRILDSAGDLEHVIFTVAQAFGLPAVEVLAGDLTGQMPIGDLPDAVILRMLREGSGDEND